MPDSLPPTATSEAAAGSRSAPGVRRALASRPALAHAALALALSWAVWIPGLLLVTEAVLPIVAVGAFGPAMAGALLVRAEGRSVRAWARGMAVFRVRARWYAVALGLPLLESATQTALALLQGVPLVWAELPARLPAYVLALAFTMLLGGGQEEPGWRGYLLPALLRRRDPLLASAAVGVVWATWHLPLFAFDVLGYGDLSFGLYVVLTVSVSTLMTWLHHRTGGSVVIAMVFHAAINTAGTWVPVAAGDLAPSFVRAAQAVVTAAFVVAAAALVARTGTSLGASRACSASGEGTRR